MQNLLYGQSYCGTSRTTSEEKQLHQHYLKSFRTLRKTTLDLPLQVIIVTSETGSERFERNEIDNLLLHANETFGKIGIKFHLKGDSVTTFISDEFVNFETRNEANLRAKFDRTDAINIYFVKSILNENGTRLSGYTSLPTLSVNSNRLFFSYGNNTIAEYNLLLEKTFLHEMGHYFGLLHTFQDNDSPDISERELVTRGVGANCSFTGDLICDTQADPYSSTSGLLGSFCNEITVTFSGSSDVNGDAFNPDTDNIMSYYVGCGNSFTPQQYQRMEALAAIRVSPDAAYQLLTPAPYIAVEKSSTKWFCQGTTASFKLEISEPTLLPQLRAEISDTSGYTFKPINARFTSGTVSFQIPEELPEGQKYRLRVSTETVEGFPTEHFEVRAKGSVSLNASAEKVNPGDSVLISVSLTGSGPWNFTLNEGSQFVSFGQNEMTFWKVINETTSISVISASQSCPISIQKEAVRIEVAPPDLNLLARASTEICSGESVELLVNNLNSANLGDYLVEIHGNGEIRKVSPSFTLFGISFLFPDELPSGIAYQVRLKGKNIGDYSTFSSIFLKETPPIPALKDTYFYCLGEEIGSFEVNGGKLNWYANTINLPLVNFDIDPTVSGEVVYFVSQTNEAGCESGTKRVEFRVHGFPTAYLSGDTTIYTNGEAMLHVTLSGESPWKITFGDNFEIVTSDEAFVRTVKPVSTINYRVISIENRCGAGSVEGSAQVQVIQPLSLTPELTSVQAYPVPALNTLTVVLDEPIIPGSLGIIDLNGRNMNFKISGKSEKSLTLDIEALPSGNYVLVIPGENSKRAIRFFKQ